jgi:hypothetical protein
LWPLVGEPFDRRLDGFMQWALNTKLAADREPNGPEAALLKKLETLIAEIIPPRPLHFVVNRTEGALLELRVDTGDGVVPFDLISQGMSSIFNWIGVLLQRLYDVFPASPSEAERKPSLVLVDEIDAHLHPEWQRRLVDLVKKHFTNVRVIATSHSPLIVSALARDEVRSLRNGRVEKLAEDLKGKNAEDILTSAGFGLDSTRADSGKEEIAEYLDLLAKPRREPPEDEALSRLSKRFGELRYATSAREERVRKAVYQALQAESGPASTVDPELRLLIERELGAAPIRTPHNEDGKPKGRLP